MDTKRIIAERIQNIVPESDREQIINLLEIPRNSDMGDLAFPAFSLTKILRKAPQMIAADVAKKVDAAGFEKIEAVGPHINFFLDKKSISTDVLGQVIANGSDYASQDLGEGRNVAINMSSPNIAKPFSTGHPCSTVVGDSLANIFGKLGYKAVKINHLGNWGKQFGMLIVAYKKRGDEKAVRVHPIDELLKPYVRINAEAKTRPGLDEEAREWFCKLEAGDKEAISLWQWFRDESLVEFNRPYDELGVSFDNFDKEAFYNDKMDRVVDILTEKGLLEESQGVQVVNLEKYGTKHPALIKESGGATLYITRDLVAALYRKRTYDFAKAIHVVGNEQSTHFKQLKVVLNEVRFEWNEDITHVPSGLVTKKGKGLSTRKDNVILPESTITEAIKRAENQINAKNPNLADKEAIAYAVDVGAIKFYDLETDRLNGYDFNFSAATSFEGEAGPYVQHTYARIQSALRKAEFTPSINRVYSLDGVESWEIVKLIQDLPRIIKRAADSFEPSIVAKFAISLAQSFNEYYVHAHVLDESPKRDSRLASSYTTATVLKEALRLLGVEAPNEM